MNDKQRQPTRPSHKRIELSGETSIGFGETCAKNNIGRSNQQVQSKMLTPVKVNVCIKHRQPFYRNPRQRPTLLELSKKNYNAIRQRPFLARQELLKDKLLSQELATRLAEAKLALLGPEVVKERRGTSTNIRTQLNQRQLLSNHVSFLSVSKRVANIIRFSQAAQRRKPGTDLEKENSSLDITEALPMTPRFSSYMSAPAQYALMKGYEDIIFEKLSTKYPDCTTTLKRNKTPYHSIAISDKPNKATKPMNNFSSRNTDNVKDSTEDGLSTGLLSNRDDKKMTATNEMTERKEGTMDTNTTIFNSSSLHLGWKKDVPEKTPHQINTNEPGSMSGSGTPIVAVGTTTSDSFLPSIKKNTPLSPQPSEHKTFLPNVASRASIISAQNFPELTRMRSSEALQRDRRIVLSYRIENAMDILDTIKTKSEMALSPRVNCHSRRHIAPLRDFNRWADQWATEFHSDNVT